MLTEKAILDFENAAGRPTTAIDLLLNGLTMERAAEFEKARDLYREITTHLAQTPEAGLAREHINRMDMLIDEKRLYERIHRNALEILTRVGMNLAESPGIMELLLERDAVDMESTEACLVPLRPSAVEKYLESLPRSLPNDPGKNAFGTGGTPPFLKCVGDERLRAADRREFEEIVRTASEWSHVVDILSVPVKTDRTMSDYECALCMEKGFSGLKMISTHQMADRETAFLAGKDHWLDGTSLLTCLAPMESMVDPFVRSIRTGNNLLILDFTIAGVTGPNSPEALLTHIHAQELFMMILAQMIRPGTVCVHGGIPSVTAPGGDISYSMLRQPLINAAMARLNLWVTGLPSAQSGGSTSIADELEKAVEESSLSRDVLRRYGVHIVRHAFGALGNLTYFSLEKFIADCSAEDRSRQAFRDKSLEDVGVVPLHLPEDDAAMEAVREIAEKGNPMMTDHTLRHVDAFAQWEERVLREDLRQENVREIAVKESFVAVA